MLRPSGLLIPLLRFLLVLGAGGLTQAVKAESDPPSLNRLLNVPGWIDLNLNLQAQPLANPGGGTEQSASWMQQLTLGAAFSSGLAKPADQWHEGDHWRANLQLMLFSGDPQLNAAIGAAYPLQSTAHPTGLWLTEATIERRAGKGELALKAGVFSLNPGFVMTPVLDQYVHSALNDTLNFNIDGLPINPYVAPGLQLSWTPGRQGRYGEWRYGAFWLDAQVALAGLFVVNPDLSPSEGSLHTLQWTFTQLPGASALAAPIRRQGQTISRRRPPPRFSWAGAIWPAAARASPMGPTTARSPWRVPVPGRRPATAAAVLNHSISNR